VNKSFAITNQTSQATLPIANEHEARCHNLRFGTVEFWADLLTRTVSLMIGNSETWKMIEEKRRYKSRYRSIWLGKRWLLNHKRSMLSVSRISAESDQYYNRKDHWSTRGESYLDSDEAERLCSNARWKSINTWWIMRWYVCSELLSPNSCARIPMVIVGVMTDSFGTNQGTPLNF